MSSHEPPSPAPAAPLAELRVFGVPALVVRGVEAPLSLKRAHALLAYLAFHAGPVPRSHLATLLWPDATEGQARARLRRLVYTMEETAGFPLLVAEHDGLALRAGHVQTDALQFARLARRLVAAEAPDGHALCEARAWLPRARSPLLQGIAFGSEAFDDWLKAVSIEHELLLARLLERMADALAKGGRPGRRHRAGRGADRAGRLPRAKLCAADAAARAAGPQRRCRSRLHALRRCPEGGVRHPARPADRAGVRAHH